MSLAICLAARSTLSQGGTEQSSEEKARLNVAVRDGVVTMDVKGADVVDVLREVCRQANIKLEEQGSVPEKITRKMRALPLEKALKKLLRRQNYEMMFGGADLNAVEAIGLFPKGMTIEANWTAKPVPPAGPLTRKPATQGGGRATSYEEKVKRIHARRKAAEARAAAGRGGEKSLAGVAIGGVAKPKQDGTATAASETTGGGAAGTGTDGKNTDKPVAPLLPGSEFYVQDLKSSDSQIRESALLALGEIGGEGELAVVASSLKRDTNDDVRWVAAEILGDETAQDTVPQLMASLESDTNERVREASADSLGKIGDPQAAETLIRMFSDESTVVQEASFDALKLLTRSSTTMKSLLESAQPTDQSGAQDRIDALLEFLDRQGAATHDEAGGP